MLTRLCYSSVCCFMSCTWKRKSSLVDGFRSNEFQGILLTMHLPFGTVFQHTASPPPSNPPEGSVHSNSERGVCRVPSLEACPPFSESVRRLLWLSLDHRLFHFLLYIMTPPCWKCQEFLFCPWNAPDFNRGMALQSDCLAKIYHLLVHVLICPETQSPQLWNGKNFLCLWWK